LENARLESAGPRRLACSRCGTAFTCDVGGSCWCAEETAILPMPADGGDCLCRDCLRKAAEEHDSSDTAATL
jgi:hypothetical protein